MHTYAAPTCKIIHNSDLSGETIIKQGNSEVSIDLYDILEFIVHQAMEYHVTTPLKALITDETNDIIAVSIETSVEDDDTTRTAKFTIRGEEHAKA